MGKANEVVRQVLANRDLLENLLDGLESDDAIVRMRAADVLEKVSVHHPQWLQPHVGKLLRIANTIDQQEVHWHVAQILGRLQLGAANLRKTEELLKRFVAEHTSRIVRASALEALADLAERYPRLRDEVRAIAEEARDSDIPSLAARARKVLRREAIAAVPDDRGSSSRRRIPSRRKGADTRPISQMRNLGPACERDLNAAGILTAEQLKELGPEEAFTRMLIARVSEGRSAKCCNAAYLYALYGAINDLDWRDLPEAKKREFKALAAELRESGQFR